MSKHQRRYRWHEGLRFRVSGLLILLLLVNVVLGIALSNTFSHMKDLEMQAERTSQNVLTMEKTTSTFADMTSALRGFVLTGQEPFLQPYYTARAAMDSQLADLQSAVGTDSEQLARITLVKDQVANWHREVAEPEIAAKRAGRPEAGQVIASAGGRHIEAIRTAANAFKTAESVKRDQEMLKVSSATDMVQQVTWLGIAGAAALVLTGFWVFAGSVTRATSTLAHAAGRIASGDRAVVIEATLGGEFQEVAEAFSAMSMTLAAQEEELQAQQEELIAQNEELMAQQEELQSRAAALEKQDRHVSRLNRIGQAMIGSIEIDQISPVILDEYLELYGGAAGLLLVADLHSDQFVVQAERWVDPQVRGARFKPTGFLARTVETKKTVMARYPDSAVRIRIWNSDLQVLQETYVPFVHAGRVIGVAVIAYTENVQPAEESVALSGPVARQAAVALAASLSHMEVKKGLQALQEQAAQVEELNAQLEEERDRASAQLDIYLSIVSTMRPGAWLTDTGGNLLVCNATFRELFGDLPENATLETALTKIATQLPPGDPFVGGVRSLVHSGERAGGGTIQLQNGYVLQWSSAPVGAGDALVGRLFTFEDVTELAKLDRLKSEFVNTVSHELRTPLTSIMGYLSLVMNEQVGSLEPQQKEFLSVVKRNTDRLSNLINDLLDVQRIEAGRMPLQCRPVHLPDIIRHVSETFRVATEQKGLSFQVELPAQPIPLISADPDRLTQIASNLVSNAVKYTREGGVRVKVSHDGTSVTLVVEDTGVGISPVEHKRVFEKFYRSENKYAREAGGTGLGLSIVKMLVDEHGGHIKLDSEPGKGSRFTVSFPLVLDAPMPG
jgi:signal transduction histidine kinase/CHASE3 domain sensor protein